MIITSKSGHEFVIDDEDWDLVKNFSWSVLRGYNTIYAQAGSKDGSRKPILMHRLIMNAGRGETVDHIDGNGSNNKKTNLRFCTRSQNQANQQKRIDGVTSRFKGVYWHKTNKRWCAVCSCDSRPHWVGSFDTETEAALAYNIKAITLFGEFAKLNQL
jgi:hypothetical protein